MSYVVWQTMRWEWGGIFWLLDEWFLKGGWMYDSVLKMGMSGGGPRVNIGS